MMSKIFSAAHAPALPKGVKFKDRVDVIEVNTGSGKGVHEYAGCYPGIVRKYSAPIASAGYSSVVPPGLEAINVASLPRFPSRPESAPNTPPSVVVIQGWHINVDGCIYQGGAEHSSRVVRVDGNIVTTASGSRYLLHSRDAQIKRIMEFVLAQTSHPELPPYDPNNDPLSPPYIPLLLCCERFVYGDYSQYGLATILGAGATTTHVFRATKPPLSSEHGVLSGAYVVLQSAYDAALLAAGEAHAFPEGPVGPAGEGVSHGPTLTLHIKMKTFDCGNSLYGGSGNEFAGERSIVVPASLTLKQFVAAVYRANPESAFFRRGIEAHDAGGGLFGYESNGPMYSGSMLLVSTGDFSWKQYYIQYPGTRREDGTFPTSRAQAELRKLDMTLAQLGFSSGSEVGFHCGTR